MVFHKMRFLILGICLLLFTGCNAEYLVEINDNKISESGSLLVVKNMLKQKDKNGFTLEKAIDYTYEGFHDKYNVQEGPKTRSFVLDKIDDDDYYGLNYSNDYDIDNYSDSPILNQCYESVIVNNDSSLLKIQTSKVFNCFDYYDFLNEVVIKIKSNHYVKENNADEVNNNIYIWKINKNNYQDKEISIIFDKNYNHVKTNNLISNIILIIVGSGLLVFGIIVYFKVKNNRDKGISF